MAIPVIGRNCNFKKNDVVVENARNVTMAVNGTVIDYSSLGDEWRKILIGMSSYSFSFEYMYTLSNTEQNAIEYAALNRTSLNDVQIFIDSTSYFTCDVATDADACMLVSDWNVTFNNDDVVVVSVTLQGSGPLHKTTS